MIKKIISFVLFTIVSLNAQVYLESYKENNNEITLKLNLSTIELLSRNGENGFYDESKSGRFALPTKSIIVGIPFSKDYKFSSKIISKKDEKFSLGFNPEVIKNKEGNLKYNFMPKKLIKDKQKPILKVNGYFWQDEMYCVNLEINQFNYDDIKSILSTIEEIEIKIGFGKPLNLMKSSKSIVNKRVLKTLINGNYASNYWGKPRNAIAEDNTDDWIDYSANYVKVGVAEDGIYRVKYNDLTALGVATNMIVPKTFKLLLKGEEIPIFVSGEADNNFDPTDYIEFVGIRNMGGHHRELSGYDQPYNEYLGRYTDTTVYWLTWNGVDGKRVNISNGNASTTDTLDYYSEIIHSEKNGWFDFSSASLVRRESPFWIENKTWNEGNLDVGTKETNFSCSNIYPNTNFKIFTKLQDRASSVSTNAHLVALSLNSNSENYDSTFIDKYQKVILNVELNSNLLNDGSNTLKIHSFATSNITNTCKFDWFEIEYPRYLKPVSNSLTFTFPYVATTKSKAFKLLDISSNNFSVWKYGDATKKYNVSLSNTSIIIADTVSSTSKFFYSDVSQIKSPKFYYLKQFTNLRKSDNKADYIIITHPKFINKVNEYSNFIATNYSVSTKTINIEDIYDEYSYGFFNPEAIKSFLISTHDFWQSPKPNNVFLIGGATYDYYGNKHKYAGISQRVLNYVPSYGAPVSDNWFVIWDSTGAYIPQMNIGRLPVTTDEEFDWYFEKHKNYLTQENDDWNKRYLFFSGGKPTNQSQLDQMRESNQYVIDNFVAPKPIGGKFDHFYKTTEPPTNFGPYSEEYLENAIDKGGVFISYLGHSGTQTWDNSIVEPNQLKNNINRYPIISDFGCSTGRFAESDIISFSQLFTIGSDGQALAYVGNSSLGFVSTSLLMPKLFYKKILQENILTVSEAHKQAKLEMLHTYGSSGIYKLFALTNTFFGDPLLALSVPEKPNLTISNSDISAENSDLNDLQDSVKISFIITNLGKVTEDSVDVLFIHHYELKADSLVLVVPLPIYSDTLSVYYPIKKKSGNHVLNVELDYQNKIDEIYEDDNSAESSFYVAATAIRPIIQYSIENRMMNKIKMLNPTKKTAATKLILELSNDDSFTSFSTIEKEMDSVSTMLDLNLTLGKRYWGRTRLKGDTSTGSVFSFVYDKNLKFSLIDSLSMLGGTLENLKNDGTVRIDSSVFNLDVYSAGFNDGNTAVIERNGVNYIPESTIAGHHVVLFNATEPYEFVEYHYFNTLAGGNEITKYNTLLDSLTDKYLVAIAVSDEGTPRDATLKANLKTLGSKYIDNVGWRASWAFIGRKGAAIGSMPEAYKRSGKGAVSADTTKTFLPKTGNMLTAEIGQSIKWDKLVVSQETPSNSSITYTPIGIKADGVLDTLAQLSFQDSVASLSIIDADLYPTIKILANFTVSDDTLSPVLKSLGVDYTDVAELAINYQVVSIEKDSITQGDKNKLSFAIFNVGETKADSVTVKVDLQKPDNSSLTLKEFVTSIDSSSKEEFEFDFEILNSFGFGSMAYSITIDEDKKIAEFFEDNNFFQIPFYVKKDTSTSVNDSQISKVTFDDVELMDWKGGSDFVSNNPTIVFKLSDKPNQATTSIKLDNSIIQPDDYDSINKTYSLKPELSEGKHTLYFSINDGGIINSKIDTLIDFKVSNKLEAKDIYNYPNPASIETHFTFRLAMVPEELDIKIYSVAGRLIKTIEFQSYDLRTGINKKQWDLRDQDGDEIANGVYLYKIILKNKDKVESYTQKLAIVK